MKASAQVRLGAEIRRRRLEQGLTLELLAARANVSTGYLGKVEKGRADVGLPILTRIAEALGAPLGVLFGPHPKIAPKALAAGLLFEKAPPELQTGILAILRFAARAGGKAPQAARKTARKRAKQTR